MDGPGVDEERVYRTVLVKSLPPSASKQNLMIHFQSRKNGGGDIEELKLLDQGSAIITFEEEKVAKSVQRKTQTFNGVMLTVEQYKVLQEEMEVFSKVSAIVNPKKLGLTMQEIQTLLKEIVDDTKVVVTKSQDKREFLLLTGTFQQLKRTHRLFGNFLSKGSIHNGNASNRKDASVITMKNGKEPLMNGTEIFSSIKETTKVRDAAAGTTFKQSPKTSIAGESRLSSKSEKEKSPNYSGLMTSEKEKTDKEIISSKPSENYPRLSGSRTFVVPEVSFKYPIPSKESTNGLLSGGKGNCKNKYSTLKEESSKTSIAGESRLSSKSEKEKSPNYSGLTTSEKEKAENDKEIISSKPSENYPRLSGSRPFVVPEVPFKYPIPSKESTNGLLSGGKGNCKNKYSTLKQESSISKQEKKKSDTNEVEISSKAWYVFVKIYGKELKTVMADFSVQIEPDDNHSVAVIKPSGECRETHLKIAGEKLKKLYEESMSKMKSVRFALADAENREHDGVLRKTVLQVKKDFPVFLERAEDRQSWEIFGEDSHVEKGMKVLEKTVNLERKEHLGDYKTSWEEASSEEDSDDADDKEHSDDGEEDGGIWNEKLEHQLGKVKVSVYRGDITEEQCDVIVNAANEKLEHGAGVALAIVSKGGHSIQDECRRIVNTKGMLKVGDVTVSPSGKLDCKMVIHAVVPTWKKHKEEEAKELLKKACKESLMQAEKYSFHSVAFPAVSSEIFGMPKHICAEVMFDVAEEYSKIATSLRDIRFVNYDAKTVRAFRSEFKIRYGSGKVISEKKEMRSGEQAAKSNPVEDPSVHGDKKPSSTWKVEKKGNLSAIPNANRTESTNYPNRIYPGEISHSSSLWNGLVSSHHGEKAFSKETSSYQKQDRSNQNQPRGSHVESKDKESRAHTHSNKHGVVNSHFFSGGAKPKKSQSHLSKDECSICYKTMKRPKTLPKCKHTFCKTCLETALQHSPRCPYCREPVEENQHSSTLGYRGTNGYQEDDVPFYGSDTYDDNNTLCLLCAKPARHDRRTLPCRHTFCRPCFDTALVEYSACPCCSELERHQPSTHYWNQGPYDPQFSCPQGSMDMGFPQQGFAPDLRRDRPRSNRGNRPAYTHNYNGYGDHFGLPVNGKRRGQPGRGSQPDGTMRDRLEIFSLPGYDGYGTIVIQYSFNSGLQGPDHPNPGLRYDGTSRSAYLPDCPEGRQVLKLLRQAFDAGLIFRIGRSQTSKLDNQIIWADIPHKSSTSGGTANYGYPDPTYLSTVKQQLQAALNAR